MFRWDRKRAGILGRAGGPPDIKGRAQTPNMGRRFQASGKALGCERER
jgi:hypothetical protein